MLAATAVVVGAPGALLASRRRRAFDPPIGVCRGPSGADAAKAAGASYLEISCAGELRPMDAEVDLDRLRSLSIPAQRANGFLPGRFQATGPDADHDAILEYARVAFERAEAIGMTTITFGSSGARSLPDDSDRREAELQFTSLLARMAEPAAAHAVTVCVEPLQKRETNFINRVDEAIPIVRAIDHPSIRITPDVYHMLIEDESADSIREAGDLIAHVHIAEEEGRRAPGVGGEDFTPYLRALKNIEYRGPISIECAWRDFDAEVGPAVKALRAQLEAIA